MVSASPVDKKTPEGKVFLSQVSYEPGKEFNILLLSQVSKGYVP